MSPRRRGPSARTTVIVGLAAAALCSAMAVPSATADPLASAKAQAAALAKTVASLQTQAEVATETYDATESRLNVAVGERVRADQQLTASGAGVASARATVGQQALMLYENGSASTLLSSILTSSSPATTANGYQLASDAVARQQAQVNAARALLAKARGLEQRDAAISREVINLQRVQSAEAEAVQGLLAKQRHALAAANGAVLRIMRADQAAAAAASQAQFLNAVNTAGGSINLNGPITAPNTIAAAAIAAAHSRIGVPYVWGATGPNSFDCSGLTQWSYAHAGISLPRTAAEQWNAGPHPSLADLEPGDLLFWALNTSDPATIHHVAMYIGHGLMIAAPHTGENVQIQPVYDQGLIGAMRPWSTS